MNRRAIRSRLVPLLAMIAFVTGAMPDTAGAQSAVYRFVDADGVLHFTNAPVDTRYEREDPVRVEGLAFAPPRRIKVPTERDYDHLILQVAAQHRVEPGLVKAVIAAESNFKPHAVSRVGAQGLMQLMPATSAYLGVERPFGVVDNIDGGVRYLRAMLDRYGDVARALAAYNAGPGAVDRHRGVPPYRETRAYIKRVLEYYRRYRADFEQLERSYAAGTAPGTAVGTASGTSASERAADPVADANGSVPLASRVGP